MVTTQSMGQERLEESFQREPIGNIIQQFVNLLTKLFKQEIALVKAEGKESVKKGALMAAFALLAFQFVTLFFVFLGLTLMILLFAALEMTLLASCFVVTILFLLVSLVFAALAYKKLLEEQEVLKHRSQGVA